MTFNSTLPNEFIYFNASLFRIFGSERHYKYSKTCKGKSFKILSSPSFTPLSIITYSIIACSKISNIFLENFHRSQKFRFEPWLHSH